MEQININNNPRTTRRRNCSSLQNAPNLIYNNLWCKTMDFENLPMDFNLVTMDFETTRGRLAGHGRGTSDPGALGKQL